MDRKTSPVTKPATPEPIPVPMGVRKNGVLFEVVRRQVVGTVREGGTDHQVLAGPKVIANQLVDAGIDYGTRGITDTLQFNWGGYTITVDVKPS